MAGICGAVSIGCASTALRFEAADLANSEGAHDMQARSSNTRRDGGHGPLGFFIGVLAVCGTIAVGAAPAFADGDVVNKTTETVTTTTTQDPMTKNVTTTTTKDVDSHVQSSGLNVDLNNPCPKKDSSSDIAQCLGLGFAVGGFFFTEPDIITTTIDGGSVRILEQHQREASIWLELHDTFYQPGWMGGMSFGPFVALQLGGTAGTFNSFAAGGMLYFPPYKVFGSTDNKLIPGFGLGVGYGWTQIHRLGDGIVENQPLPPGVSTVRFKQTDIGGPVIMLSTTVTL